MTQLPLDAVLPQRITPGAQADRLATATYSALLEDLALVTDDDWDRPSGLAGWTVRDMVAHVVGAAEGQASMPTLLRQYLWGMRHRKSFGGSSLDAMNQRQIDDQRPRPSRELPPTLAEIAPRAVEGRARRSRVLGWAPYTLEAAGSWYPGMPTRTTMRELCSVVLTRDVWAHRVDLALALDRPVSLDPQVDGAVVADVVADWAYRHGQPFALTLDGVAGGDFRVGHDGPDLHLDALDFALLMAGRQPIGAIPESPLWATRVLF